MVKSLSRTRISRIKCPLLSQNNQPSWERKTISYSVIESDLKKNKSTVSRAIQVLKDKNWLPDWFELELQEQNNTATFEEVR